MNEELKMNNEYFRKGFALTRFIFCGAIYNRSKATLNFSLFILHFSL